MGKATREAYGEALKEIGGKNEQIVVLDADLSKSTKTNVFAKAYPQRFFNVGIAEQNLVGTAAGLAASGKTPFVSTFAMFAAGRAFEQIRNSVCYPKLNVKVAATHAGLTVGEDGASHQAIEDVSLMRSLPNMTVLVPADEEETRQAIAWAAAYQGPVYIRLGRMSVDNVSPEGYVFAPAKAAVLTEGNDVALIANGVMVMAALEAAKTLAAEGIQARVINMASVKPLDEAAVVSASKETGAIVTCEEHSIIGGLGSAVAEVLAEQAPEPLERVGVKDTFGESGSAAALVEKYQLDGKGIYAQVKEFMK